MPNMKPQMPENAPVISLSVAAQLINDTDRYSTGFLTMTVVTQSVTEDGLSGGWIGADPGCGIAVKRGSRTWKISALDLYRALAAQDEEYVTSQGSPDGETPQAEK